MSYYLVNLIIMLSISSESPLWQLKLGYSTQAYLNVKKINKINGVEDYGQVERGFESFGLGAKVNESGPLKEQEKAEISAMFYLR